MFDDGRSHYTLLYTRPSSIDGSDPGGFLYRRATTETRVDYSGAGYRRFDGLLDVAYGAVIEADFDPRAVARTLTESGDNPDGTNSASDAFPPTTFTDRSSPVPVTKTAVVPNTTSFSTGVPSRARFRRP